MSRRRWFGSFGSLLVAASLLGGWAPVSAATPRSAARTAAAAQPSGAAASSPSVRLVTPSPIQKVLHFPGQPIYVNPGTYLAAVRGPWQVDIARHDYTHPIHAWQTVPDTATSTAWARPLPDGLASSLNGLDNFFQVVVRNRQGKLVSDQWLTFCPSGTDQRTNNTGPLNPTYPRNCYTGPFALGSVIGIDRGWAVSALGYTGVMFDGKNGNYTLRISIGQPYRDFFGISSADATSTVALEVRKDASTCLPFCPPGGSPSGHGSNSPAGASGSRGLTAAQTTSSPASADLPDLIALPAWAATITTTDSRDYLEFAATIWNRGPSPLVVEGFRAKGQPKMAAWQYFYDAQGNVMGRARVGNMHYDARPGHEHWHFEQFARYSLLDASKHSVVLSQKEAFCLAPTDGIDMTVPGAAWNPGYIGLSTACGDQSAIWVREVLPTGWGDTYIQSLPGQSLDITSLPNGTYYLSVEANPDGVLFERNYANNTELRQVKISGTLGHRNVHMTPWHGITI